MAKADGKITSLSATVQASLQPGGTSSTQIATINSNAGSWFGPSQPLAPLAPRGVGGRRFDYPFGVNLQYIPRSTESIGFGELRALADSLPILRAVIETRKDQIASLPWMLRPIPEDGVPKRQQAVTAGQKGVIADLKAFLRRPDGIVSFDTWLRTLAEDMLVIDAATIYPRPTLGGGVFSLDVIDGATIKPLMDESGRRPAPPNPAYQQILKGIVAADFTADELIYMPRNPRTSRIYGYSPVEQIVMTINIALRREVSNLEYYRSGTVPDSFGTLPKEWSLDQIKQFQEWFESLMQGNTQARSGMRFMPADFKYEPARQPALQDKYDEWIARLVCYVFSVPPTPFVAQTNRATAETQRVQASQEGLVPLQQWIKHFMDHIVQDVLGNSDLEFAWSDGDTIDPMVQMQVITGYVAAGLKSRDEGRDEIGEGPIPDGSGSDYTITGGTLSPARLPTPDELAQQHAQSLDLINAKKPAPGDPAADDSAPDPAEKLAKDFDESLHPRNSSGQFASTGTAKEGRKDTRPRDENGRFIPGAGGGASRGFTAAGKRKRLVESVKNAAERAVGGAVLVGGAMLATAVFAPTAPAAIFAIGAASIVGRAAIGDAASTAVLSVMDFLKVPPSIRDTVQTAVTLGLGAYGLAGIKGGLDDFMAAGGAAQTKADASAAASQASAWAARTLAIASSYVRPPRTPGPSKPLPETPDIIVPRAPARDVIVPPPLHLLPAPKTTGSPKDYLTGHSEKVLKSADDLTDLVPALQAALYEVGQDVIDGLKAKAKAASDDADTLKSVNSGFDQALDEFLDRVDALSVVSDAPSPDDGGAKTHPVADMSDHPLAAQKAAPVARTLYANRKLVNGDAVRAWMLSQGFKTGLPDADMHVTSCYSKTPLVWPGVSLRKIVMVSGGKRSVEQFGKGAVVLTFESSDLAEDNARLKAAGATSDFPDFQPHVTLTYEPGDVDLSKVEPFEGELVFGPECFQALDDNWQNELVETHLDKMRKRKERWRFIEGGDPDDRSVKKDFNSDEPRIGAGGAGGGEWTSGGSSSSSSEKTPAPTQGQADRKVDAARARAENAVAATDSRSDAGVTSHPSSAGPVATPGSHPSAFSIDPVKGAVVGAVVGAAAAGVGAVAIGAAAPAVALAIAGAALINAATGAMAGAAAQGKSGWEQAAAWAGVVAGAALSAAPALSAASGAGRLVGESAVAGEATAAAAAESSLEASAAESAVFQSLSRHDIADVVAEYQSSKGARVVNSFLRNPQKVADKMSAAEVDNLAWVMKHLDGGIAASETVADIKVFRGISKNAADSFGNSLAKGSVFQDLGYTSTSSDLSVAQSFADRGGKILHISVPKGSKVLDVEKTLSENGFSSKFGGSEKEHLFGRQASFRVDKISGNNIYVTHITGTT